MIKLYYMKIAFLLIFLSNPLFVKSGFVSAAIAAESAGQKESHVDESTHDSEVGAVGPHQGKLLTNKNFSVEIVIAEASGPPKFKVYVYLNNKMIPPEKANVSVELSRLDGEKNNFSFVSENDYLLSKESVNEPHSFDVKIKAHYEGHNYEWTYPSYEGRTILTDEAIKKSDIKTEVATGGTIKQQTRLNGRITLNRNTTHHVRARFPGIVKKVYVNLGEQVKVGQLLASIESNDSLKTYNIESLTNGTVLSRATNIGDVSGSEALFTIADLSEVWGEFHVFPRDLSKIQVGQEMSVATLEDSYKSNSKITMLLPTADPLSQTVIAIAPLSNKEGKWRPGMIIEGSVLTSTKTVPLVVRVAALQKFRDFTVVFAKIGNVYEVRMLELGDRDEEWVEVKSGLKPGTDYVVSNSFIIKADIEKSGASHDH